MFANVDEFQNFTTESFETTLGDACKNRLSLTVANQYQGQLDDATRAAIFGNVGGLLVSQVGDNVHPRDLLTLPKHTAYVRPPIDAPPRQPFSMRTLPPDLPQVSQNPETIRRGSRRRYGRAGSAGMLFGAFLNR